MRPMFLLCLLAACGVVATRSPASAATLPALNTFCSNSSKTLCVLYPAAWNKSSFRTEKAAGGEKITAVYAYHPSGSSTGFAEGFDASASPSSGYVDLKEAMADQQQALVETGAKITYSKLGDDWYVLSGTDFRGNVFYDKVVETGRFHKELNVVYPARNSKYWQGFLGQMARDFR